MTTAPVFKAIVSVGDEASAPLKKVSGNCSQLMHAIFGVDEASEKAEQKVKKLVSHEHKFAGTALHVELLRTRFGDLRETVGGVGEKMSELLPMFAGFGALATAGGIVEMVNKVAEGRSELAATAIQLGMTAQQLQNLNFIAQQTDVPIEAMHTGMTRLNRSIADAAGGQNKEAAAIFKHIGLSLKDSHGHLKSATEILPQLAQAFKDTADPARRTQIAMVLMGRGGADMLPLLMQGKAGLDALAASAEKIDYNFSEKDQEGLEKFHHSWLALGDAVSGFEDSLSAKLAPVMSPLLDDMTKWVAANRDWIATDISNTVKNLGAWLKNIDWKTVGDDAKGVATDIGDVADHINALKWIIDGFIAVNLLNAGIGLFKFGQNFVGLANTVRKMAGVIKTEAAEAFAAVEAGAAKALEAENSVATGEAAVAAGGAGAGAKGAAVGLAGRGLLGGIAGLAGEAYLGYSAVSATMGGLSWLHAKMGPTANFGDMTYRERKNWESGYFHSDGSVGLLGNDGGAAVLPDGGGTLPSNQSAAPITVAAQKVDMHLRISGLPQGVQLTATSADGTPIPVDTGAMLPGVN